MGRSSSAFTCHWTNAYHNASYHHLSEYAPRWVETQDSANTKIMGWWLEKELQDEFRSTFDLDASDWSNTEMTSISPANIVSPFPVFDADGIVPSATNAYHCLWQTVLLSTVEKCTVVGFAKEGSHDWICLSASNGTASYNSFMQVTGAGIVGTNAPTTAGHIRPCGNGWYKAWIDFTPGQINCNCYIGPARADGDANIVGDGSTISTYFIGTGSLVKACPTSPIKAGAALVTRASDSNVRFEAGDNIGGKDNQAGTVVFSMLCDAQPVAAAGDQQMIVVSDGGSGADKIDIGIDAGTGYCKVTSAATGGNAGLVENVPIITDGVIHKIQVSWQANSLKVWVDGVEIGEDTSCDMPDDLDRIEICPGYTGHIISMPDFYGEYIDAVLDHTPTVNIA